MGTPDQAAALRRLDAAGETINFAAVAQAAGISRAWLYRDDAVRAEIDRLRRPRPVTVRPLPAAEQATADSLRQQLDAVRSLVAELRAENHRLWEAVSRKLGQQRADVGAEQL